jgi:predicted membrane protein
VRLFHISPLDIKEGAHSPHSLKSGSCAAFFYVGERIPYSSPVLLDLPTVESAGYGISALSIYVIVIFTGKNDAWLENIQQVLSPRVSKTLTGINGKLNHEHSIIFKPPK